MTESLYPVASPGYLDGLPRAEAMTLSRTTLLHDRDPETHCSRWFAAYPEAGADIRKGSRFTASGLALGVAAAGLGCALARHRLVGDDVAAGRLTRPCGDRSVGLGIGDWLLSAPVPAPVPAPVGRRSTARSPGCRPRLETPSPGPILAEYAVKLTAVATPPRATP